MQKLKKCPKYVKNLFKHKKLEYIAAWDIYYFRFLMTKVIVRLFA